MANSLLTIDMITREALRVLHQKSNFIGSTNRQYDDSFARTGAKIGDTLRIRKPNRYLVRTGRVMQTQDTTEEKVDLSVNNIKGVDMAFTSQDLTMKLDDFSSRIIEPAVAVLAASVEAEYLDTMRKLVYNTAANTAAAITFANVLQGRRKLQDTLTPLDNRTALLNTNDGATLIDALKGLFQDTGQLSKQYREGYMGRAAGFDFNESTFLSTQTRGAGAGYLVNGASQSGSTLVVDTGTGLLNAGEVFTIAGVFSVHPETKVSTGILQQFVVISANATNATSITISPSIVASGASQNVSNVPADNSALTVIGTASTNYGQSMLYHRDAFTFATADLEMPPAGVEASRQNFDGVSMRLVRGYDITNDVIPCRLDILYGYAALRPELACRLANLAPA